MELHNLKPAKGSVRKNKRKGRGQGSGSGGTSTRGHKGAKSRSGYKEKRNHEGGQMPLQMRLPKRGFKSPNRVEYIPLNLFRLQEIHEKYSVNTIDPAVLYELGIVKKNDKIKILGVGDVKVSLTISAHGASGVATDKITAAGGTVNII
ncbi:MAG TPA: 50S ribosomal protein L15 [Saprospiraceae bacterium]|nr:50S ribosomal protein L15 [Saprospiraceae bacterium]